MGKRDLTKVLLLGNLPGGWGSIEALLDPDKFIADPWKGVDLPGGQLDGDDPGAPGLLLAGMDHENVGDLSALISDILSRQTVPVIGLVHGLDQRLADLVRELPLYTVLSTESEDFPLTLPITVENALRFFHDRNRIAEQETRYRNLFEIDHAAIVIFRKMQAGDWLCTAFNRGAERIEGRDRYTFLGTTLRKSRDDLWNTPLPDLMNDLLSDGQSRQIWIGNHDYHLFRLSGSEVAAVYTDESDHFQCKMEAGWYRTIFNRLEDPLFIHNDVGQILDVNERVFDTYGYRRQELVGKDLSLIDAGLVHSELKRNMAETRERGFSTITTVHRTVSGELFDVEVSSVLLDLPDGRAILSKARDIRREKEGERRLAESEERFSVLLNGIVDPVLIHPVMHKGFGEFIAVNKAACSRYGYSEEEFLNLGPADISVKEDVEKRGKEEMRNSLKRYGRNVFQARHKKRDGSVVPVLISSNVCRLDGREVIISIVRDETDSLQPEA